jgi:hypothetical protein
VFAIAISIMLLLGVEKVRSGARQSFADTISGTDLIVGARRPPGREHGHSKVCFPSCKTWITLSINSTLGALVPCRCPSRRINSACRLAAT